MDPALTDPMSDEIRRLMRSQWGDLPLDDQDRLLALFGLVEDPYARHAFGRMSLTDRLTIIADRQMEAHDWNAAYRTIVAIDRIERRRERAERAAPNEPALPEPRPEPSPALTPREQYLQRKADRRDLDRARAGKPPFPRAERPAAPPPFT